jgi:hypothetical protein
MSPHGGLLADVVYPMGKHPYTSTAPSQFAGVDTISLKTDVTTKPSAVRFYKKKSDCHLTAHLITPRPLLITPRTLLINPRTLLITPRALFLIHFTALLIHLISQIYTIKLRVRYAFILR